MPNPQQFYESEKAKRLTSKTEAQANLGLAQQAVAAARKERETRNAALAKKNSEISALRRALAEARMPADMDDLLEKLRAALIELRATRSDLLDADETLAAAEADLERARATSASATAALAAADQAVARETERQKRHTRWIAQLAEEPLASVPDRADDVLAGDLFSEAKAVVEEIPQKLRERAAARLGREMDRQKEEAAAAAEAEDDLAELAAAEAGKAGKVARAWSVYRRAEESLGGWVLGASTRLDQAVGLLEKAKDAKLTAQENAHLDEIVADAAADLEKDYDEALLARDQAVEALEAKKLALRTANVDATDADIEADPSLEPLNDTIDVAQEELDTAAAAFDEPARKALEAWEAAVPDAVWDGLAAFERARRILLELKAGPGDRAAKLSTAETALVTALEEEAKSGRTLDFLRARAERLRGRLVQTEKLKEPRIARALRGEA